MDVKAKEVRPPPGNPQVNLPAWGALCGCNLIWSVCGWPHRHRPCSPPPARRRAGRPIRSRPGEETLAFH